MTRYDKIYVPVVGEKWKNVFQCNYMLTDTGKEIHATKLSPSRMLKESESPLICMTIEEAKEMWAAAEAYILMPMGNPNFTQFIESKGITI